MNESALSEIIQVSSQTHNLEGKYLTFILGQEEYGLDIGTVREIIKVMDITHVPKIPDYIKGVINLRDKVIPVMDLRLKFGMDPIKYTKETCIIVVETGRLMMGVIVDTVSEVVDISEDEIEPPPAFGGSVETQFILGMGKFKGAVKVLLDIEKVLSGKGLSATQNPQEEEGK